MALLFFDGFDNYGTSGYHSPSECMERRWTYCNDQGQVEVARIPGNGYGFMPGYGGFWVTPRLTTRDTLIVGFAYRQGGGDISTSNTAWLMYLLYNESYGIQLLQLSTVGELAVYRGSTFLGVTSGAKVANHRWNYIEMKVKCHDTLGTVEVRVNGKTYLSLSGVDTKESTYPYYNCCGLPSFPPNYVCMYDDWYVCDDDGAVANDFLGSVKVVTVRPASDVGGAQQWTPQSGVDHYAMVDENPANDNTDYVETDGSGNLDLFEFADSPSNIGTIHGVNICAESAETDAEAFSVKLPAKRITQLDGSALEIGGTGYKTLQRLMVLDTEGVAWTKTNFDATQFGIKLA